LIGFTGNGLQESKAGLAVGKLRSHGTKEVSDLAKEIVRKWKNEVEKEKQANGVKSGVNQANSKTTGALLLFARPFDARRIPNVTDTSRKASKSTTPTVSTPLQSYSNTNGSGRSAKSDGVRTDVTGDKTRDKCVELIYDALASDSGSRKSHFFLFIRLFVDQTHAMQPLSSSSDEQRLSKAQC
jgi:transcription elongation factor S-II